MTQIATRCNFLKVAPFSNSKTNYVNSYDSIRVAKSSIEFSRVPKSSKEFSKMTQIDANL